LVPGRENVRALVPPMVPRELDARNVLEPLLAAERAIATTAAVAKLLPHPDLITRSLERREAVLSSQIEGTRTDLTQLLEYEATGSDVGLPDDAAVTLGYVRALDHGLRAVRRQDGPKHLTLDLIRQLRRVLMSGTDYRHPPRRPRRVEEGAELDRRPSHRGRDADSAARVASGEVFARPGTPPAGGPK
jgi:Fic family protein